MSQTLITLIRSGDVERVRALLRLLSTQLAEENTDAEISKRLKLGRKSLSQIVNEGDESGLSPLYCTMNDIFSSFDSWSDRIFQFFGGAVAQNEPAGSVLTEILLQHGASITELEPRSGFTPVHLAAYLPHKEALEVLLKQETTRPIALNVRTPNGATPLHLAARKVLSLTNSISFIGSLSFFPHVIHFFECVGSL
jgi:hypothetical protein